MNDRVDVAVAGGALATFRLGAPTIDAPEVLAIHGITSNSRTWLAAARALGDRVALVAVDLRGRAASRSLPEPFGLAAHVRDMIAVLDHFELDRPIVAGHSLGAYVAARLALDHPDRVSGLVLVDGGLTIPVSQDADPEQFTRSFLAPTLARLELTFADQAAYRGWWAQHPAIVGSDIDDADLDEYAAHDLVGVAPNLRSSINPQVVGDDGIDLLRSANASAVSVPAVLLCAPGGMIGDSDPMQPLHLVQAWAAEDPGRRRAIQVPGVNHYTIALGRAGATAVAGEIVRMAAGAGSTSP